PLSLIVAMMIHMVLILLLLLVPRLAPETLSAQLQHLTFLITPPPPPSAPRVPAARSQVTFKKVIQDHTIRVPREIPRTIEFVMEEAPLQLPVGDADELVSGGNPGGTPNGVLKGVLGAFPYPLAAPPPPSVPRTSNRVHRVRLAVGIRPASLISQLKAQ